MKDSCESSGRADHTDSRAAARSAYVALQDCGRIIILCFPGNLRLGKFGAGFAAQLGACGDGVATVTKRETCPCKSCSLQHNCGVHKEQDMNDKYMT